MPGLKKLVLRVIGRLRMMLRVVNYLTSWLRMPDKRKSNIWLIGACGY